MGSSKSFIGRFDSYCGRVRALYTLPDGNTGATDWYTDEASASDAVPDKALVDSRNRFCSEQAA